MDYIKNMTGEQLQKYNELINKNQLKKKSDNIRENVTQSSEELYLEQIALDQEYHSLKSSLNIENSIEEKKIINEELKNVIMKMDENNVKYKKLIEKLDEI